RRVMAREVALPLEIEEERPEPRKRWKRLLSTARKHPLGVFGLGCVSLLFFCGIFADLIVPFDPEATLRERQTYGSFVKAIAHIAAHRAHCHHYRSDRGRVLRGHFRLFR